VGLFLLINSRHDLFLSLSQAATDCGLKAGIALVAHPDDEEVNRPTEYGS
jgi:hypothetical protein